MSASAARAGARRAGWTSTRPGATSTTGSIAGSPTKPGAGSAAYLRLVVARRSSAARAPFIAVVVAILALGLLGLLLLNTVLAQDAFKLHALQVQGRVLADQEQGLQRDVERLQSPQALAGFATALGMVPGGPPAFLELPDGKVLGQAVPGSAAPSATVAGAVPAGTAVLAKTPSAATTTTTTTTKAAAAAGGWVVVSPSKPGAKAQSPQSAPSTRATQSGPAKSGRAKSTPSKSTPAKSTPAKPTTKSGH